ncbi:alpha/beta fold hydrolase [Kineococcus rhizosphaerae]|uniref:Pimeloyl-ACP methyl ester carboxylesterase n=1 Tax=Kineococcus rhizosphaerae TaxID=559628 RepID=A0A2T0R2R8_9ACTN|nr:alpha/beta hydrolase [Kineococcus rhizosphaerae]PRY14102.1 pimeloyl-ACP methyl ester carboxylesterase [Kineococcus rhizosphaerae]
MTAPTDVPTRREFRSDDAPTEFAEHGGYRYAYRRFGPRGGTPLVLCLRFRGTMDHWDPAFLEVLSDERDVVVFDNRGLNLTSGPPAQSIEEMGRGLLDLLDALGLPEVDVLGWSLGGMVAQAAVLAEPGRFRHLVVAGSTSQGVPGQPAPEPKVWQVAGRGANDDEDFLYLFFPETPAGRAAGLASLRRLDHRLLASGAVASPEAVQGQLTAIRTFTEGFWERLPELTLPVLVANGSHDVMINSYATYAMSTRLPDARALLYSDAGHGFLFQHAEEFGAEVLRFLRG